MQSYDFLVIGSGPAGQKAAIQGAKCGLQVCLVESESQVGGMCVHKGTIPSKSLRESALRYQNAHRLLATDQPTELAPLMLNVGRVISAHDSYISAQLTRNHIHRIHGRATFIDRNTIEIVSPGGNTQRIKAKTIFIATGSKPRQPDNIAIDHEHVLDSDSILSMNYLPHSMLVLGGGVIACEYASVFAGLGTKVTLVDRFPNPLGFLDADLPPRFVAEFEAAGGRFLGNQRVESAAFDGVSEVVLKLENGEQLMAEKMLVALGRVSSVKGLHLDRVGVSMNEMNFVEVNEFCQTNVPNIYAIGDVIGPPSLASSSMEQGRRGACHALGIDEKGLTNMIPVGIYAIPELSAVGLSESQARALHGNIIVGYAEFSEVARGLITGSLNGMLKMISDPDGVELLGVHIVGEGASELIHLGQMAMIEGTPVDRFVEQIFNFPTLAEAYRVAALSIRGQVKNRRDDQQAAMVGS
ncbi:MAG: NAD(P) transhydrogenase [Candidatus Azotimanducaceae bacterium]|jgi:NAD(P) transhydrogenase